MNYPGEKRGDDWGSYAFDYQWPERFPGTSLVPGVTSLGVMSKRARRFPFSRFPDLEYVGINNPRPEQLIELAALPKLKWLAMTGCRFKDLTLVAPLRALRDLSLDHAQIESVEGIGDLPDLRVFVLEGNSKPIAFPPFGQSAKTLTGFTLRKLLPANKISLPTLAPVRALKQVKYLDLRVYVTDQSLAPLHELTQLEHLDVSNRFPREEILALRAALPHVKGRFQEDRDE